VESKRTGLGAAVLDHISQTDEAGHTGNGDDMPVVLFNHARHEFAHHKEVRDRVYFECLPDLGLWLLQNRAVMANARIVDENRGIAELGPDLLRDFGNAGRRGNVGFVERNSRRYSSD
jgi:hypothetical protein